MTTNVLEWPFDRSVFYEVEVEFGIKSRVGDRIEWTMSEGGAKGERRGLDYLRKEWGRL